MANVIQCDHCKGIISPKSTLIRLEYGIEIRDNYDQIKITAPDPNYHIDLCSTICLQGYFVELVREYSKIRTINHTASQPLIKGLTTN